MVPESKLEYGKANEIKKIWSGAGKYYSAFGFLLVFKMQFIVTWKA